MVGGIAMASDKGLKGRTVAGDAAGPVVPSRAVAGWALLVALVGALLYVQTLSYDYAMDDYSVIVENVITRQGAPAVGEIMTTAYRHGHSSGSDGLYRPISKAIFAVLWGMGNGSPAPMHAVNVLAYGITGALLFLTLFHWLGRRTAPALFAAMLFIAMPIHTEVVANIKSLDEILALIGFLWASLCLWRREREPTALRTLGVVAGCALSMWSKESAITFLPLYPAALYVFGRATLGRAFAASIPCFLVSGAFLLTRMVVLQGFRRGAFDASDNFLVALDPMERIPTAISIVGRYLTEMLVPTRLTFDASLQEIPVVGFGDAAALASVAVSLGMAVVAVWGLRRRSVFGFAMLAWFSTASVSSNLVMLIGTNYGERLMYAPSFGIAMAVGCLLARSWRNEDDDASVRRHAIAAALVAVVVAVWAVVVVRRNPVWADNNALYESGVITAPKSMRTQFYLGNHLMKEMHLSKFPKEEHPAILARAVAALEKSIEMWPKFAEPHVQLGLIAWRAKDNAKAIGHYKDALAINPNMPTAHNNLGAVYASQQKNREALDCFVKASKVNPSYADAWSNAGLMYHVLGQKNEAVSSYKKAISLNNADLRAMRNLAVILKEQGSPDAAMWEQRAAALGR